MAIYRGTGTSGTTTDSASISDITHLSDAAEDSATAAATSATNAANSAASASTSASNAATNATAASDSATQAANAVTAVQTAATQATNAELAAEGYADDAEASAIAAAGSASGAATSETNAAASATIATTQASAANTSALSASSAATSAATQANISLNAATSSSQSASNAALSETAAANSETAAATSESNAEQSYQDTLAIYGDTQDVANAVAAAATSETNAGNSAIAADASANDAADSEANAAASETAAASSAAAASTSATAAANSATAASNSASAAAASESIVAANAAAAATSESNAAASATAAAGSQTAAEAAKDAALAALDSFDDRYLGDKATEPTVDNDGNPLVSGALYFNTVTEEMKVYSGTQWLNAYASLSGALLANNNLSDLQNVVTARSNLGLGTAATTDSTAYATAAQGALADSALQSETDPVFTAWDKSTGISITESQISDFGSYQPSGTYVTPTYTGDVGITGKVSASDGFKVVNSSAPVIEVTELGNSVDGKLSFTKNGVEKAGIRTAGYGAYARKGLAFHTNNTGDYTTESTAKMWLTAAGDLGIGTSAPTTALDVVGTVNATTYSGGNVSNWDTAYGWGDHSSAGYLTSYTETDPVYTASSWYTTTNNASNWDTAYGWGDHASAGYQPALGFTPVQQGGGTGQGTNKLYMGWSGSNLLLQVDSTNFGGTWPISISGDASTVDGLDVHTGTNNEANKIVRTDANGYIMAGWINTPSGNTTGTLSDVYVNTNDGYIRKCTLSHLASQMGVGGIVNVYTDTQTGVISTTSSSFVNTGLAVTFTPASASSRFIVHVYHNIRGDDSGGNSAVQTRISTSGGSFIADYGSEGTSNNYTTDPTTEVCTFTTGSTASVTVNVQHLKSGGNTNNYWHDGSGTACLVVYEVA